MADVLIREIWIHTGKIGVMLPKARREAWNRFFSGVFRGNMVLPTP